jgi:hypothetical protein
VRKAESLQFFVFNTQHWCESHPLRQIGPFVSNKLMAVWVLGVLQRAERTVSSPRFGVKISEIRPILATWVLSNTASTHSAAQALLATGLTDWRRR